MVESAQFYTDSQRQMQKEQGSEALAEAVVSAIVSDELTPDQMEFIQSRDFFFLSTVNGKGEPTVSYKGGPVGVARPIDERTIIFPNYDGNGMFYSMGNTMETGKIGFLFIDMQTPNRLRVQGTGRITKEAQALRLFPGSNMVVEVRIDSVFVNCARYIHKHSRLGASPYVPKADGSQPFPAWKRLDKIQAALPEHDQHQARAEGDLINDEQYEELLKSGES